MLQHKKTKRSIANHLQAKIGNRHAILWAITLLLAAIVALKCADQKPAWIFLILVALALFPSSGYSKILTKIRRIRKAIDK